MNKSRIDYENLIRNSILFSLDKNRQTTAYRREALKLVEYLYLYLNSINPQKYKEFGLEITETANRCIKNYVAEFGDFLNYFNKAIAKEYRKALANKQLAEQHGGIHIPENDLRIIKKYIKYSQFHDKRSLDYKAINAISLATGISKKKISDCVSLYKESYTISDIYVTENDDEESLFALIASDLNNKDYVIETENVKEFLNHINNIFKKRQARQKPLISKLITSKIAIRLSEDVNLLKYAKQLDFFDINIYNQICTKGCSLTAKEIGNSLGLSEQSVSRTYKTFISLL